MRWRYAQARSSDYQYSSYGRRLPGFCTPVSFITRYSTVSENSLNFFWKSEKNLMLWIIFQSFFLPMKKPKIFSIITRENLSNEIFNKSINFCTRNAIICHRVFFTVLRRTVQSVRRTSPRSQSSISLRRDLSDSYYHDVDWIRRLLSSKSIRETNLCVFRNLWYSWHSRFGRHFEQKIDDDQAREVSTQSHDWNEISVGCRAPRCLCSSECVEEFQEGQEEEQFTWEWFES